MKLMLVRKAPKRERYVERERSGVFDVEGIQGIDIWGIYGISSASMICMPMEKKRGP